MKTDSIILEWRNDSFDRVIRLANLVADELKLNDTNKKHLIMLTEETLSMEHAILGTYIGELHYELNNKKCELIITSDIEVNSELKATLLRMSSSGKNEYKATILDKLSGFFKKNDNDDNNDISDYITDSEDNSDEFIIETNDGEVWDESERAILHHLANQIKVGIKDKNIIIKVIKDFSK